jgi:hypothetical protein
MKILETIWKIELTSGSFRTTGSGGGGGGFK